MVLHSNNNFKTYLFLGAVSGRYSGLRRCGSSYVWPVTILSLQCKPCIKGKLFNQQIAPYVLQGWKRLWFIASETNLPRQMWHQLRMIDSMFFQLRILCPGSKELWMGGKCFSLLSWNLDCLVCSQCKMPRGRRCPSTQNNSWSENFSRDHWEMF